MKYYANFYVNYYYIDNISIFTSKIKIIALIEFVPFLKMRTTTSKSSAFYRGKRTVNLKEGGKTRDASEMRRRKCFTAFRYQDVRIARVALDKLGAQ